MNRIGIAILVAPCFGPLALSGCSSMDPEPVLEASAGTLELPLSVVRSGSTYRFLGTIHILSSADLSVAATVESDAASPSAPTVSLQPGQYTIEVVEGYSCSVDPDASNFTGCTYTGSSPDPFTIAAGVRTEVGLGFTFHFEEDVGVVFRTGDAVLSLVPALDMPCGGTCATSERCVSIDSAEPACASTCETSDECGGGQACFSAENDDSWGVCAFVAGGTTWVRQFGSSDLDNHWGGGLSVDASGNVVVSGVTAGTLSGQTSLGGYDAFVTKHDANGNLLWTRQFGTSNADDAHSVGIDTNDNVLLVGNTYGVLPGQTSAGNADAFVSKYDPSGEILWTRQFGGNAWDYANSVRVDVDDNVLVAGATSGALPGQIAAGDYDIFVAKYDSSGNLLWTRQLGTSSGDDARNVGVDKNGNVLVVGTTAGILPGQSSVGSYDAFVAKYDPNGSLLWLRQFGSVAYDEAHSVSIDANDNVLVGGHVDATLPGQNGAGGVDAFVAKYDPSGSLLWLRQFGTSGSDYANSISVDSNSNVVAVGYTDGALPGLQGAGNGDAFVAKYDANGNLLWNRQLGTSEADDADSVQFDPSGSILLGGHTYGAQPGQSSAGSSDVYLMKLAP